MIRNFNFSLSSQLTREEVIGNYSLTKQEDNFIFKCMAQVLDNKPIPCGEYYDEDNRSFRSYSAMFVLDGVKMTGSDYRKTVPLLLNHYGKDLYSQNPKQSLSVGVAENFRVKGEKLFADISLLTKSEDKDYVGGYIANYIKSFGAYPMSVGISADDTLYNENSNEGNLKIILKKGIASDPDLMIFKTSEISEVSFVYQGRVESAQAFIEEDKTVTKKEDEKNSNV